MNWEKVRLGDVCEIYGGTTPSTLKDYYWNGDIVWLSPTDLPEIGEIVHVKDSAKKITSKAVKESSLTVIPPGAVVYSTRASIGKIGIAEVPLTTNQGFANFICNGKVFNKYLAYALKFYTRNISKLSNSTTFAEVSRTSIRNFSIPLPRYSTQQKIAAILDKADELRRKDQQLLTKYDELLQSIFYQMFGNIRVNDKHWEVRKLGDISDKIQIGPFGSLLHVEDYVKDGIPLINPMHIVSGKIKVDNNYTVSIRKATQLNNYRLKENDVIMGRRGEMGRCAVVHKVHEGYLCGTGSLIIRLREGYSPIYYKKLLSSNTYKNKLEHLSQGVTMNNLNQKIISDLKVSAPPLEIQRKFEGIYHAVNSQKEILRIQMQKSESLFLSLLQKAFKGELLK